MASELRSASSAPYPLTTLQGEKFDPSKVLQNIDFLSKILEFCDTNPFPLLNKAYSLMEKTRTKDVFIDLARREVFHLGLLIPVFREVKKGDFRDHPARDAYLKALHITFRREISDKQWKEVQGKVPGVYTANRFALMKRISDKNYDYALLKLWESLLPKLELENPPEKPSEIRSWMKRNQKKLLGIKNLDLHGKGLKVIPREIKYFRRLEELYLYNNQIQVMLPEIFELTLLTTLHLSHNRVCEIPIQISRLTRLKYLYLTNNRISSLPLELCTLRALYLLQLGVNKIGHIPPQIKDLTHLHALSLFCNNVDKIPDDICELPSLMELDLSENDIEEVSETIQRFFHGNRKLQIGSI